MNGCPNGCCLPKSLTDKNNRNYCFHYDSACNSGWYLKTHDYDIPANYCIVCGARLEAPELDKKPLD
jgi:hypothetical protein